MAELSRYLKIYPSAHKPGHFLLFSTLRCSTALVPAEVLDAARSGSLNGTDEGTLRRLGVLVDDLSVEREQMRTLLARINGNAPIFKATAILNLDCNLDCGYCYEGKFRNEQYMTKETAQLLVDTLIRDHLSQGREVALSFYGGEPLLSEDLIRFVSLQLQEAARLHNAKFSFNLVTNGTLLNRQTAERLVPLGLKIARITLDGPPEIHNRQRPYTSGSGSFDTIIENIAAIWDIVQVNLGGNFYRDNYHEFPRLLDHLTEAGITPDKLLRVQFNPVTAQAGCADSTAGCVNGNEPWLIEAYPKLREEILRRGFRTTKPEITVCMIELENVIIVNYDGTLYKCPALMGWEGYGVGTLADGLHDYTGSHCIGNWQNDECLDCAYLPLCFGGCRFLNLAQGKALGDIDCRRQFFDGTLETVLLQNIAPAQPALGATAPSPSP